VTTVAPLNRTLDQEVFALLRGASLECLVCGEFVLHRRGEICCPECGLSMARAESRAESGLQFGSQAG
jgi:Zn finger protein HypA/HybF involved in hydrogenase expression